MAASLFSHLSGVSAERKAGIVGSLSRLVEGDVMGRLVEGDVMGRLVESDVMGRLVEDDALGRLVEDGSLGRLAEGDVMDAGNFAQFMGQGSD